MNKIFLDYSHNNRASGNETFRTLTSSAFSEVMLCQLDPRPTTGVTWYMVWPGGHDMVYGMACRAWHGIWYGLEGMAGYMAGMTLYMVWPGGHGMIYGMA